jgi:mono/diheme cytochrome c family protein
MRAAPIVAVSAALAWLTGAWLEAHVAAQQQGASAQGGNRTATSPTRQALDTYCVSCHSDRLKTAGLSLAAGTVAEAPAHAEVWEKVVRKLRSRTMPPAGSRRPDEATYDRRATEPGDRPGAPPESR